MPSPFVIRGPGGLLGPCIDACSHPDCLEIIEAAAAPCDGCGKPIGFDSPYYLWDGNPEKPIHDDCTEARFDPPS